MNIKFKEVFSPSRGIADFLSLPQGMTINKTKLNTLLFSSIGERYITSLVVFYITKENELYYITNEKLEELTSVINEWYNEKWQKQFDALQFQYNLGDDYKREEVEKITLEGTENLTGSENTQNKVFGFDNENPVNDKTDLITSTNANTNTSERERNLLVTGKLAGKSYQSLIREELKLRENNLLNTIFTDIKKMVVLPIY